MTAVRDDEHVWRDVYFRRQMSHLKRQVANKHTKAAFADKKTPEQKISTSLYDRVTLGQATREGDHRAKKVQGSTGIQGWWVMRVDEASQMRRVVEHSETDDNPNHADIILPDREWEIWEDVELHIKNLISIGWWQDTEDSLSQP